MLELVSRNPSATFLNDTAVNVPIMPKHIWESVPASGWNADPGSTGQDPSRVIGSGPFTFVEWNTGANITVARNDNYWLPDEVPVIDRYIYRVVAESTSALQSLQTGESDISAITPALAVTFIEDNPDFDVHEYDRAHITYVLTNMDVERTELFQDVRVRQAMMYALDRDLIAEEIFQGYAVRADGPQPPLSPAYAPDEIETIYLFEPDTARSLLEDAGWTEGPDGVREKDGVPFAFDFTYEQDSTTYQQLVPYLQQAWGDVGLQMTPYAMPFPAQQEELNKRNYHTALTGITMDATGNQGILFRCDATYPAGFNEVAYCNPEYDALDDAQRKELDPEKRRELMIEAANIIAHDVPVEPLVFVSGLVASSPRVHNYFPSGYSSLWSINWVWVEQ
jgi:ABC-type transport system substrate-binding protein